MLTFARYALDAILGNNSRIPMRSQLKDFFPKTRLCDCSNQSLPVLLTLIAILWPLMSGCSIWRNRTADISGTRSREFTFSGIDAMQRGRPDRAEELFREAVKLSPEDSNARAQLAGTLSRQGATEQAINQLRAAVEFSRGEPKYQMQLGEVYLQAGQAQKAIEHANLALDGNRRLAAAWLLKGNALQALGQLNEAVSSYHRAIAYDKEMSAAAIQLAATYQKLDRPFRSLSVLEKLDSQFPDDRQPEELLLLQGVVLADLKHYERSVQKLSEASLRPGASAEVFLRLSDVQVLAGDPANARLTLSRGREIFSDNLQFAQRLSELPANDDGMAALEPWH
ncbi:tetratricopeptide repeat protein [Vicingaceae bacterium]|nr:tetratricopeptide repeat protein [Vicingaceae bacterium]